MSEICNNSQKVIKVASRKSQLALVQTNLVISALKEHFPNIEFEISEKTTVGDKVLDVALSKIGEKGLFTKELEVSLLNHETSFAVHSLKDMPTILPDGLIIGAISKRTHYLDVLIMNSKNKDFTLSTLPHGSVIGTSSLRRISQLKRSYPHLIFKDIRGNLQTRLNKLDKYDEFGFDGIILAEAGISRLNLQHLIHETISPLVCYPAVGQGALAIECREGDEETLQIISKMIDFPTQVCCEAERSFMHSLQGGCHVPVATFTQIEEDKLTIYGRVLSLDGSECVEHCVSSSIISVEEAKRLGNDLADILKGMGALSLLERNV